jgi:hypothetical protein
MSQNKDFWLFISTHAKEKGKGMGNEKNVVAGHL